MPPLGPFDPNDPRLQANPFLVPAQQVPLNVPADVASNRVIPRVGDVPAPVPGSAPATNAPQTLDRATTAASAAAPRPTPTRSTGLARVPDTSVPTPEQLPFTLPPRPQAPVLSDTEQRRKDIEAQGSGRSRIHNPVLKGLATVGDILLGTFAPRAEMLTPGTEGNYMMRLARATHAEQADQAAAEGEARTRLQEMQAEEARQRGIEAGAHAQEMLNPAAKPITNELELFLHDPALFAQYKKALLDAGTTHEPQFIRDGAQNIVGMIDKNQNFHSKTDPNLDPQAKAMMDAAQPKAEPGRDVQGDDGTWYHVSADNTATPIMVNGQPLKGKVPEKTVSPEQQFIDEYRTKNPGASIADAERAYKAIQPPERPPQTMMLVPGEGGQMTATVVRPGQSVAANAITPSGASSINVKEAEATQAEQKARADAQKEYQLAQTLVAKPSPTNDLALVMRYIGATKPDSLGKLRLNQNEVNMVLGTRSLFGNLEALEEKVRNGQMLTPQQRKDMLNTMQILSGVSGPATTGKGPAVGTIENGYRFKGGDPSQGSSWERVK